MRPVEFPEQHGKLRAPEGMEGEVVGLPVWMGDDMTVSCWKMSWRERISALLFGTCWLSVLGPSHPPVHVGVARSNFEPDPVESWTENQPATG